MDEEGGITKSKPRLGSLFTGIGGFDLAFERAGGEVAFQVEINSNAQDILRRHWPGVSLHEDIHDAGCHNLPTVDVLAGGFPCQDLSVAGSRAGLAGQRSGLFFEYARIIGELRPAWVVIENVPGLLSSNGGRDMEAVIGALEELGYGWAYRTLDAQYFGVPQRRRRVFIVCHPGADFRGPADVLFEPESLRGPAAACSQERQAVAGTIGGGPGRGRRDDFDSTGAYDVGATPFVPARSLTTSNSRLDGDTDNFVVASPLTPSGGHHGHSSPRGDGSDNLVIAVRTAQTSSNGWGVNLEGTAYTLDNTSGQAVSLPSGVRRLTPKERERLQGFPDNWTEGQADTHRDSQTGNAVAVPVAEWLFRRILAAGV